MERKHLLKDMTFVEFRDAVARDPVILLPFGSQEEQGPACPMGDWMLTEALAARVAESTGAIAAPTVPFGYADYFRTIPGGIQLKADTFVSLLTDVCENFLDHGLTRLLVFNGHSGNYPLIDQTIRRIKRERGVIVPCINLWRSIPAEMWSELHPGSATAAFGHGADPLTSVYLHLFPELVRTDLIGAPGAKGELLGLPTAGLNAVRFEGMDINVPIDVTERCEDGIVGGDPRASSADVGRRIAEHVTRVSSEFVLHLQRVDTRVAHSDQQEASS